MKVLSLFDGMSCDQIALRQLGIIPETYYASEIDKHAIKQTQLNFPDTIQLGNVEKWNEWDIDLAGIDLLLAGSPCQGFSFAGKQLAFNDPRSKLFFVFIDILNHIRKFNPDVFFLLENVNMKKEYIRIISEYCDVFPVNINSNLVSAQNRDRWYWTNIQTKQVGLFGEVYSDIPQPEDKGIFLQDILEKEVDEKYYISGKCLDYIKGYREEKKYTQINGKKSLPAMARQYSSWNGDYVCVAMRGREAPALQKNVQKLESRNDGKTNCLTSVDKDNLILQRARGNNPGGVFEGKTPTLSACSWEQNNLLNESERFRRLTPIECARLQTIPDWYKWKCSDTQIYKMLGNGWTVDVIVHILSFMKDKLNINV